MNSRYSLFIAAAAVLALVLATGCARTSSDTQLASDVQSKLATDTRVSSQRMQVLAKDGIVTLNGTVSSDSERLTASDDAALVPGVRTVINNLQVQPVSAETAVAALPKPPEESARPRLRRAVAHSAEADPPQEAAPPAAQPVPEPQPQQAYPAAPAPTPAPPAPEPVTIPAGTTLYVRMLNGIDSEKNAVGDTFRANLDSPLEVDGRVVVPAGAEVTGRVAEDKSAGHFAGKSQIALELTRLNFHGHAYTLVTDQYTREGNSRGKRTAATIGGGAVLGAVIGAIAGGGKGAAIGSVAGAGAGTAVQGATKGQQVKVDAEAVLAFRLQEPVAVRPWAHSERRAPDSGEPPQ
ncbi:MAG TPA: BON domain-containing protein [Terriglobales bacterium]|nr:BON domain-containing protein [Terriglobales bacterium]